jgi:hypothetical protein
MLSSVAQVGERDEILGGGSICQFENLVFASELLVFC